MKYPKNGVCSIIVTYNPEIERLFLLISSLEDIVDCMMVIDNNSNIVFDECFKMLSNKCRVSQLPKNLGVAAAYNIGINSAKYLGFTHVLLMDQDSIPSPDMVSKLLNAEKDLLALNHRVSAVGPAYEDKCTGNYTYFTQLGMLKFKYCHTRDQSGYIPSDFLISSGSLISISAIDDVGFMDESLFIDLVDTEWFLRARAKGYQSFGVPDAIMHHSLGNTTRRVWIGRWRYVPQHHPFRNYYMFRNSISLYKRAYVPLMWKVNDLVRLIYLIFFTIVYMPERSKRIRMVMRGVFDGIRDREGPLECR